MTPAVLAVDAQRASLDACQEALLAALPPYRRQLVDTVTVSLGGRAIPVAFELTTNTAPAGILDAASRWNADAIVIGTHGRSGLARMVIGSTAESVARLADIPVIVIRERATSRSPGLRRIVVGIPSSTGNEGPFALAMELAREHGVRIVLAAVADGQLVEERALTYGYDPAPLFNELRAAAKDALEKAVQEAEAVGIAPVTSVVEEGDVASGLLRLASLHEADAILIGTHEQGVLNRFFFGTISEETARQSPIPVVIVPKETRRTTRKPLATLESRSGGHSTFTP
jgi:nucleotide-binding universal stress UspA family protein